jgi:histidinol phosphatase-like enzyme
LVTWPPSLISNPLQFDQFKLYPCARKAVTILKKLNFKIFVISDQFGVDISELIKMDRKLYSIGVDGVFNCIHKSCHHTIDDIIKTYKINRDLSYMIGNDKEAIVAGYNSGLKCLYVGPDVYPFSQYDLKFCNVLAAAKYIQIEDKKC